MPEIKPFKGWRYAKNGASSFADLLVPPYDVISSKQQEAFYKKNPHNVIRLILGKKTPADSSRNNQYTRAGSFLNDWISKGILAQDPEPSIYIYVQEYKEGGKLQTRIGFMAAMKIDEKAILKHENTLAKPKKDRMALLKEVKTNLSPIFGLFEDRKGQIQDVLKASLTSKPALDVTIDGVKHKLYVENREQQVKQIAEVLSAKPMYIADGHHRFEVACQFKNWMSEQTGLARQKTRRTNLPTEPANWNYVMTYFSDCANNPFKIFPTHRLIRIPKSMKDPLKALSARGGLKRMKNLQAVLSKLDKTREESGQKGYSFGIYSKKEGFFILELDQKFVKQVKKNPVDLLDVAVLHKMLIEPCFKIKVIEKSSAIDFTRDPQEARGRVDKGNFDLALFLRPTSLNEMILASKKGLKMPQKSTYFYPKLLSGLVFHRFEDSAVSVS